MKRVVIFCLLSAGVWLYGMEDALLPGGAPARAYQAVELSRSINVLGGRDVEENMSAEDECGQAYQALSQALPGEEHREKADAFIPSTMLSQKHKQYLSSFSPDMVSAAFLELADDPDYKALKLEWDSGALRNSQENAALERAVAVKIFGWLTCKEKQVTHNTSMKKMRCDCSGLAVAIVGEVVLILGPCIALAVRASKCS